MPSVGWNTPYGKTFKDRTSRNAMTRPDVYIGKVLPDGNTINNDNYNELDMEARARQGHARITTPDGWLRIPRADPLITSGIARPRSNYALYGDISGELESNFSIPKITITESILFSKLKPYLAKAWEILKK